MLCSIERTAEIQSSALSGMLMDKSYFNDPIATYLTYTVSIAVPAGQELSYADLYEVLTDPVAEHEFELPYNQTVINVTGRVSTVSDRYVREENATGRVRKIWRSTKFTVTSNYPVKVS